MAERFLLKIALKIFILLISISTLVQARERNIIYCGGVASLNCPVGMICADYLNDDCILDECGADCIGQCIEEPIVCNGIIYVDCPEDMICIDDWRDDCMGNIECPGICVKKNFKQFNTRIDYIVGKSPHAIALVDINNDSNQDIISVDSDDAQLSILLNNGEGIFQLYKNLATSSNPQSIAVNDFDNNGYKDIAVVHWQVTAFLTIFYQSTDGEYEQINYEVSDAACGVGGFHSIIANDFNCDSLIDLAACDAAMGSNKLCIFMNEGNRVFHSFGFSIPNNRPIFVESADLDNDGDIDLVTANVESNDLGIIMNNICDNNPCLCGDDPVFIEKAKLSANEGPYGIAISDFNNDSILDIATVNVKSNDISVFLGKGDGKYYEAVNYTGAIEPKAITSLDIDNDGDIDIISGNNSGNSITVFINEGDGTFTTVKRYLAGYGIHDVEAFDLNKDGFKDIVTANLADHTVSSMINIDGNKFLPDYYEINEMPRDVAIADFDNDEILDWCVVNDELDRFSCYKGHSSYEFEYYVTYRLIDGAKPRAIKIANFNGDNYKDILIANYGNDSFVVYNNSGNGYFSVESYYRVGKNVNYVAVADFDNDGKSDVVASGIVDDIPLLRIFFRNDLGNSFKEPIDYVLPSVAYFILAKDINNDCFIDILVAPYEGNNIIIYLNKGGSSFELIEDCCNIGDNNIPRSITAVDLNNDMMLDIVTANLTKINDVSYGSISTLINRENEYFELYKTYSTGNKILSYIESVDVNKDLLPDVIVSTNSGILVFLNTANYELELDGNYLYGAGFSYRIKVMDFDFDGIMDIVIPNYFMESISIFYSKDNLKKGGKNKYIRIKNRLNS